MSITYTPTTNFGSKDSLPSNDPNKVIKGAEFTTEFTAIQSAFGLAAPSSNPTFTGTATFDSVTANAVSLGDVTTSDLTVSGSFTSVGIDDNATSTAITIDASENVGIGTDAPAAMLEVKGSDTSARFRGVGSQLINLDFSDSPSTATMDVRNAATFNISKQGIPSLSIDQERNVGIGTSTPNLISSSYKGLHIHSDSIGASLKLTNPSTGTQPSDGFDINIDSSAIVTFINREPTGIQRWYTGGDETMRLDASGNLGIGTAAAASKLHVSETASGLTARFSNETNQTLDIGTVSGSGAAGSVYLDNANSGNMQFRIGGSERMRIDASGTTTVTGGFEAAQAGAGTSAFAAGINAGLTSQNAYAVAVGIDAGKASQGANGVAVGAGAAADTQGISAVAVGNNAGRVSQSNDSVAVGTAAGKTNQDQRSVAIGSYSGETSQGNFAVAVGDSAGRENQGNMAVAVGHLSGRTTQGQDAVAVGINAGNNTQGGQAVAIGVSAGQTTQQGSAVAVGRQAGETDQGFASVATGYQAGQLRQGGYGVAVGHAAGLSDQGARSVAVGLSAGQVSQGASSVAIGHLAGKTNQGANGIIISSSGAEVSNNFVGHIVLQSGSNKYLYYNGTDTWKFRGGDVTIPNDNLAVGTTSSDVITSKATGVRLEGSLGTANLYSDTRTCLNLGRANNGVMMQFYINGANTSGGISTTQGGTPVFFASSDERLKDNIVDHESELANVMSLRPTRWDWKKEEQGSGEGFIAQELEQTGWSDLVSEGEDGFKTVAGLGAVETRLIKAMQEQQAMIEALKAEVEALKNA